MKQNLESIGSILQSVEAESATSKLPIPSTSGVLKKPGVKRLNRDLELSPTSCRIVKSGGSNMLTVSRRRTKNQRTKGDGGLITESKRKGMNIYEQIIKNMAFFEKQK
mgnify:CR=1 FL=1